MSECSPKYTHSYILSAMAYAVLTIGTQGYLYFQQCSPHYSYYTVINAVLTIDIVTVTYCQQCSPHYSYKGYHY